MPDIPDAGNSISTECTDQSRRALRENWGGQSQNVRHAWLRELNANHCGATGTEDLPCPEKSILREVTFLCTLTCLGSTETHGAQSHEGFSAGAFLGCEQPGHSPEHSPLSPAWINHRFKTKHQIQHPEDLGLLWTLGNLFWYGNQKQFSLYLLSYCSKLHVKLWRTWLFLNQYMFLISVLLFPFFLLFECASYMNCPLPTWFSKPIYSFS